MAKDKIVRVYFFSIFIGLILALCGRVQAESLAELMNSAKKYDAAYLAAKADYEGSHFQLLQTRAKLLPSINASASLTRNSLNLSYDDTRFEKLDYLYNSHSWSFQATQPLLNLENWSLLARARKVKERSSYNLRQALSDLLLRLAEAYYNYLTAKENLDLSMAQQQFLSEQLGAVELRHQMGASPITELLQIQARSALAQSQVLEAQWELANNRRKLENIAGPNFNEPDPLDEKSLESDWGELEDWLRRINDNPKVRMAELAYEAAQFDEVRVYSGFWPAVEAVSSYEDGHQGPTASVPSETRSRSGSIGLKFTWSLFSGGGNWSGLKVSQKQTEKTKIELQNAQRETRLQMSEFYGGIQFGIKQLKALKAGVLASNRVLNAMEEGHDKGSQVWVQVLEARRQCLESEKNLNEAISKLLLNQIKLHTAVGENSSEY